MRLSIFPSFLSLFLSFSLVRSFSVTVKSPPNECGSLDISWIGGVAPFQIILVPIYNIPRNISVPSSAFSNNQGSYQISSFPLTNGTQFLLTMSDATGFGTGGTSELLTVGEPVGSPTCNTSNPALPFSYSLPSSLQQCGPYIFNQYDGATLPITVTGLIPGGDLFLLHSPPTGTSLTWTVNVAAGTTIVFAVTDAKGNSGGSSYNEIVAPSNDASCLNHNSPSSTVGAAPSTAAGSSTSSTTQTSTSSGVPSSTIIGAAVGAPLATAVIVALAVCYLKRQRRHGRSQYGLAPTRNSRRPSSLDLDPVVDNFQHPPIYPYPYQTDSVSRLASPIIPNSTAYQGTSSTSSSAPASETPHTYQHSRSNSNTDSFAALGDVASSTMSSSARRKAAMAGASSYKPAAHLIVHTDAEDATQAEPEVVELPPQYSERRTPAAHTGVSFMSGVPSTDLAYLSGQYVGEPPHPTPGRPPE